MALVLADRVQETTTTSGTGTVTLAGAVAGYQSFGTAIGNANTTYYTLVDGSNWEVGIGTYTSSGTTLSRDTVLASSAGGTTKITLSGGTTTVFVTYPAERAVGTDVTQTLTNKTISGSSNTITNVDLTTGVTGTLPIANGGTGATTAPGANAKIQTFTTTVTSATTVTLTNTSTYYQYFTGGTAQTVVMPVTSTLSLGWSFHICNNSSANVSLQSSGLNSIATVLPGTTVHITCILTTGTTAASWDYGTTDFGTLTGTGAVVLDTSPTITTPTISGTLTLGTSNQLSWSARGILTSPAAAIIQIGAIDNGSGPLAQILRTQSFSSGITTDGVGTNFTIQGSAGTGAGAGGSLIFQVAPAGSAGTTKNAYATALTIDSTKLATFAGALTVAGAVTFTTTLTVANGGTGAATLTSNNVLLGNGTGALQTVAPGTTGNVLTSNGTTWSSTAPAASGLTQFSVLKLVSLRL